MIIFHDKKLLNISLNSKNKILFNNYLISKLKN